MARDVEGVSYIAVLHQRTMEKLVEILSLVSLNIEGTTAGASDVEEDQTSEHQEYTGQT